MSMEDMSTQISALIREKLQANDNKTAIAQEVISELNLDMSVETMRGRVRYIAKTLDKPRTPTPKPNPKQVETHEENGAVANSTAWANHPMTEEEMAEKWGIDLDIWECTKRITNVWSGMTQTKLWWKRKQEQVDFSFMADMIPSPAFSLKPTPSGDCMLSLDIFDCHLGMRAYGEECGADFDLEIACNYVRDSIDEILNRTRNAFSINRVLLVLGGDILHSSTQNTTASGTLLDVDTRFQLVFKTAIELFSSIISSLSHSYPVDVIGVRGNHDDLQVESLYMCLDTWFRNNSNVTFDISPKVRKYYTYGENLIGVTHGDMGASKLKELPMMMASESPDWSACRHREFKIGHKHFQRSVAYEVEGDNYCMVRQMRSIASSDAWHTKSGFVGSRKGMQGFIYHKEKGVIGTLESTI